jgi:prophage maintenance system killer protein
MSSFSKKSYALLFSMLMCPVLQAMEQDLSKQAQKLQLSSQEAVTVDVKNVKPFSSQAFDHIPQYVYENCNQGTKHTWSAEYFKKLKEAVKKLTKEKLREKHQNEQDFIKNAESYDWINGLNYIEDKYLKKQLKLSIAAIQKINGCLSRLIEGNDGAFRVQPIVWPKRNTTNTEVFFYDYLQRYVGDITQGTDPNLRYLKNEKQKLTNKIATQQIVQLLLLYKLNPEAINSPNKIELEPAKAFVWEQESAKFPNHKPGTIDTQHWLSERYHLFPPPENIQSELAMVLKKIDRIKNPIEAAARLWYEIVRIHPWHEANKRTGKALASLFLLQKGYLPPLITAEHEKEYVQTLQQGFEKEDGHVQFIQLIAQLIDETQNKFKDLAL